MTATTLALHCSSQQTSIAYTSKQTGSVCKIEHERHHSDRLLGLLKQAQVDITQVQNLLVDIGPGSFMSLRVALAAIKAFACINNAKIYCLDSLQLLARAWLMQANNAANINTNFATAIDARRQQWYFARWHYNSRNGLQRQGEITLVQPSEIAIGAILVAQNLAQTQHYGANLQQTQLIDLNNDPASNNLAAALLQLFRQHPHDFMQTTTIALQPLYIRNQVAQG